MTDHMSYVEALKDFQRKFLVDALRLAGGNICQAAGGCGMHRNTFSRMMGDVGLSLGDFKPDSPRSANRKVA